VTGEVHGLATDVVALLRAERTPQTRAMSRRLFPSRFKDNTIVVNRRRGYRFTGRVSFASFLRGDVFEMLRSYVARAKQPDGGGPNGIRALASQDLAFPIRGVATRL
jgi:hypothetical protein